jgi:hypothetical protein
MREFKVMGAARLKDVSLSGLLGGGTPIFLAGFDEQRSRLTLHVPAGYDTADVKARAKRATATSGDLQISVRTHQLQKLAFPRSLEHWLKRFGVEDILHDPTMIVARGRSLLAAAKACRASFGRSIRSILFEPDSRTLFVVLSKGTDVSLLHVGISEAISRVCEQNGQGWANEWRPNIRVTAELPPRKTVAVDAASASSVWSVAGRSLRRWWKPGAIAVTLAALTAPAAAKTEQFARDTVHAQSLSGAPFGVLASLSVFTDGMRPQEADAFAEAGLNSYFGEGQKAQSGKIWRVAAAEKHRRRRRPDEVGQVGGAGAGGS